MPEREKPRIAITIDPDLLNWIDRQIKERRFASRSHAIEYSVNALMLGDIDLVDKNILLAIRNRFSPNQVSTDSIQLNLRERLEIDEIQDRLEIMEEKGYVEVDDPISSARLTANGRQYLRMNQ